MPMPDDPRAVVRIPGEMRAVYDTGTGKVVRVEFLPALLDDPRSPKPEIVEWCAPWGPLDAPDGTDLDVTAPDSPFWMAMREADAVPIDWIY